MPTALIFRGPPGAGKTTLVDSLLAERRAHGEPCAYVHMDEGWGAAEFRRTPGAPAESRYRDLVARPEPLLVIDLCLAEPDFAQTAERGASRNPREWVTLLQHERDVVAVRFRASWAVCAQRLRMRGEIPSTLHQWVHAAIENDVWRFAETAGLREVHVDASRPAAEVLRDVAALLPIGMARPTGGNDGGPATDGA